jgi:hypothetical protein
VTDERELFTFRVEGHMSRQPTALPTRAHPFDETYEIEGEHPADSLEKLLHEIEWGVLDSYESWSITFLPCEAAS